jgi:NADP-dependent 3-hydroxy acid dehydrogenase YdfG
LEVVLPLEKRLLKVFWRIIIPTFIYMVEKNPEVQNNNLQYFQLDITKENIDTKPLPEVVDGVVYLPGTINLKPFRTIKAEQYVEDFSINVLGAIKTIQTLYPKLRKSEHPSIVLFQYSCCSNRIVISQSGFSIQGSY